MEKSKILEKVLQNINENKETAIYEELLKNNTITFKHNNKEYRLRRLTLAEKQEIFEKKSEKFGELSNKKNWKFREQIIRDLKEKGYDIEKLDSEMEQLQREIDDEYEVLAKMADEKRIKLQEDKISTMLYRQQLLQQKRTNFFQFSIEDYLNFYVKSYLSYLATEVKVKGKFKKAFKDYNEFVNSTDYDLIANISFYVNYLIRIGELA